ncbi:hypothetical protein SAMN04488047_12910 [Tranquillimonas alkanivorans]|uniref:Uncharacterized protein n=1 Tax=Tranquillimonas alkanivorans TaxID=441119 RepID=A0A1I5VBR5_9RHOB|nr:hypothetical protein SAMN04488047_12910 [Tranquillimonas alkanivorans]
METSCARCWRSRPSGSWKQRSRREQARPRAGAPKAASRPDRIVDSNRQPRASFTAVRTHPPSIGVMRRTPASIGGFHFASSRIYRHIRRPPPRRDRRYIGRRSGHDPISERSGDLALWIAASERDASRFNALLFSEFGRRRVAPWPLVLRRHRASPGRADGSSSRMVHGSEDRPCGGPDVEEARGLHVPRHCGYSFNARRMPTGLWSLRLARSRPRF